MHRQNAAVALARCYHTLVLSHGLFICIFTSDGRQYWRRHFASITFAVNQHRWRAEVTRLHHKPDSKIVSAHLKGNNPMRFDAIGFFVIRHSNF